MKFSVFVAPKAVKSDLAATTKEEVIAELVQSLVEAQEILAKDKDDIIKAIMRREELGSTGIGRGVAVPHTKHPSVKKLVGTVGVSAQGLDFESLDERTVRKLFVGATRATMRLAIVASSRAAAMLKAAAAL